MKIHIIRHGMTEANEKKLYCGVTDIGLSDYGREQLGELIEKIDYPCHKENKVVDDSTHRLTLRRKHSDPYIYFTSGLKRANETLEMIYGDVDFTEIYDLCEYNFGDFDMHSYEELKERQDYIDWIYDKTNTVKCPNGENRAEFIERILKGIRQVLATSYENRKREAVIVAHGGTIVSLMDTLFPEQKNFYEWQPKAGYGFTIEFKREVFTDNDEYIEKNYEKQILKTTNYFKAGSDGEALQMFNEYKVSYSPIGVDDDSINGGVRQD